MTIKKITNHLEQIGLPLFWQLSCAILAISSVLVIFINNSFTLMAVEVPVLLLLLFGIYKATISHKKSEPARKVLVSGSLLIISSLVISSVASIGIPIPEYTTFILEQAGVFLVTIFAFMYMHLFERKFSIRGITIDFTLLVVAISFFYLLISPEAMKMLLHELDTKQQLLAVNIFIATILTTLTLIHFLLSKSMEAPDIIRLVMGGLLLTHFYLELLNTFDYFINTMLFNKISRGIIEFNGALLVIYLYLEKLDINYSSSSPRKASQHFMWTASISAILTIPLGLLLLSFRGINTLNLFVIGSFSLFLSSIVIWRIILLLTKSKNQRKRLKIATQTNQLTHLPNYQGYIHKLTLAKLDNILVVAINIEDFKSINDLYGREAGDQVLINLAKKLKNYPDAIFTAHSHSDLFLVVFQTSRSKIRETISPLKSLLGIWDDIDGKHITVPLTYGASYSAKAINPETLSKQAEQALKKARNERSSYALFVERRQSERLQRHEVRDILQQAVDDNHLPVHFQPIYNLDDGSLKALELLIRVDSEKHGLLLPGQFLDQAKSYGMLTALTQVCVEMVAKHYVDLPDVVININLPPYMLKSENLLGNFIQVFKDNNLPTDRFCIEVTEDENIETSSLIPAIKKLRADGFSIAMDDFGTGYSSLDRLSVLDIDTVKIDRSLLLSASEGSTEILEWAISLAKRLGISAVVEGVETVEQLNLVKLLGADSVQGFLYSRPVPVLEATRIAMNSNDISLA